jgi:membrane protease YdiL (CAAX protease family)
MNSKEQVFAISPGWAILTVVVVFVLSIFLGAFFFRFFGVGLALVFGEMFIALIPFGYMLYKRIDIKRYIGFEVKLKYILLGISFGAFLLLFNVVVNGILVSIFGTSEAVQESNALILNTSNSAEGLILVVAALSLAGICEEFTFRGFLQTSINSKYSLVVALVVSSLAFGFFHFDPQAVYTVSAFLMGLLLGFIYHHWHSYVVSATAHATMNLIVLAVLLLIP